MRVVAGMQDVQILHTDLDASDAKGVLKLQTNKHQPIVDPFALNAYFRQFDSRQVPGEKAMAVRSS